ncbi:MAG: asparagine synthase-related protein [Nitrososphaeria archaeon]|nr:asparagine synthase-related protein [Nitrososphaeria archaeon]
MANKAIKTNGYLIVKSDKDANSLTESIIKLMRYRRYSKIVSKKISKDSILSYFSINSQEQESNILIHGRVFDFYNSIKKILNLCEKIKTGSDRFFAQDVEGDFSLTVLEDDELLAFRSPTCSKPLYFSSNKNHFILSSDPYPLKFYNLVYEPIPPASFFYIDFSKNIFFLKKYYEYNSLKIVDLDDALNFLNSALKYSIEKNLNGISEVAIAFSGGIDSTLLAKLISVRGITPHLITFCLKDSYDYINSEKVSSLLSLELKKIDLTKEGLVEKISFLSKIFGKENLMNLSIALLLNMVAEKALNSGFQNLVVGQGSDELFGGYKRYLSYAREGYNVNEILRKDFEKLQSTDISRDDVSISMYCEPIFPYINNKVAEVALSLPLKYKIDVEKSERKIILRLLAKELGLPPEVYNMQKKAMQYSSGIQKLVSKIIYSL